VTIEVSSENTPGDAAGNYVIVRTFTATDDAGNSTSTTQTITVQDTTAPELTFVPADYTVECSDEMPMDDASASDNCGEVTIEVSSEITQGDAAGNYVIARTFTATDDAGNSTSATQTITVQDTTAPEFTFVPADYTVECAEEMPMDDAAAVDNCGEITIEVSSEITQGDAAGNYTITRTFTVTDDAGNSSSATQIVTVQDTTAPEFVYTPADALVECTDAWPTEVPEIVDACGSFVLELTTDTLAGLCGDLVVVKRTYLATDDAGNASSFIQTLTQIDTQGPVFDVVDEVDLSCSQNLSAVPIPTATDLCSEVTTLIWNDVEYSGGCTLPISALLRTYTAIDACGNVSQAEQVINLVDSQAPTWTFLPEDVTLECTDVYELLPAVATDNCAEPEVTWTVDTLGVVSNGVYDLVFDFIAVDDCDNIAEHQHVVHVTDTTAPDWVTFPEDHTMTCEGELDDSMPTALDACSDSVTLVLVSQEWTEGECEGSGQWVRTFSATDWNGNIQESSQMILVVDETPPAFTSIPEDATLECDEDLPNVLATAVDNCSAVTVTFDDNIEFGEGLGNFVVSRMFTATDACGNTTSAVQTFHVLDTTAPEFTFVPEGYAVECSEEMPLEEATATDNCGVVTIDVMSDTIQGDAAGNYTVVRTFTAMDDAGNSTSASQTIVVQDTTPPMLTLPEDYTVECSADMAMEDAIATDNCGAVVVTLTTDTVLGNASGNYEIRRTFTAVDDAGNSTSSTQTITVEDTTPPVVVLPSDTTVTCDAVIPVWEPVSEDNCGSTSWESTDEVLTGACSGESTILRHYVITDDAGNETGGTQTITVADDVAPTFTFVPESAIWVCNAPTVIDSAAAVDNCSAVTLTAHLDTLDALVANQWILLVTWTAEDACGNFSEATQEIQVLDQLPPTIDLGPADATLPWGEALLLDVWESELVYSDSCSDLSALTVSVHIDTLEASMACVDEVVLTWIVTDLAGNEALWMQHVNLMDNDAPAWAYEPSDFTLSCDELWEPVFPEGSDHNAFSDTVVMDTILGNCTNHYTHVWTLTAEDICGNATEPWVLNVTYVDTVAPEIVSWPEDLMLMNASEVPECQSGLVTWTDICSLATDSCFTDTVEVYCPGSFLLARTFMVTDECGNAAAVEQSILVEDVEPPTWSYFPESMTVSCDSLVDAITVDDLQVVDNASGEDDILKEWIESVNNGDNCVWNDTHTYRATDGCGNATELTSYVVEFVDDTPPSLTLPLEQLDLLCVSEIPSCEETGVDAVDDCNDWSFICSDAFEGGGCNGPDCTLIRTITVTDACGNPADFEQIITVVEPPTVPELPTGFSPNNDSYNDVYQIRNAGPDLGIPPCDWLDNTALTVFDRWGSVVYTSEDVSIPWDGTNLNGRPLPVGTYFVVFEANGLTYRETVDLRR
jgi:gliding motility-associated-like protein